MENRRYKILAYKAQNPKAKLSEIGKIFGCSHQRVQQILAGHDVPVARKICQDEILKLAANAPKTHRGEIVASYRDKITSSVGVTNVTVSKILEKEGIKIARKSYSSRYEEALLEHQKSNPQKSQAEIAKEFGVSQNEVSRLLMKNGISKDRRLKFDRKILAYRRKHPQATMRKIAEVIGVNVQTVNNAFKRAKALAERKQKDNVPTRETPQVTLRDDQKNKL